MVYIKMSCSMMLWSFDYIVKYKAKNGGKGWEKCSTVYTDYIHGIVVRHII